MVFAIFICLRSLTTIDRRERKKVRKHWTKKRTKRWINVYIWAGGYTYISYNGMKRREREGEKKEQSLIQRQSNCSILSNPRILFTSYRFLNCIPRKTNHFHEYILSWCRSRTMKYADMGLRTEKKRRKKNQFQHKNDELQKSSSFIKMKICFSLLFHSHRSKSIQLIFSMIVYVFFPLDFGISFNYSRERTHKHNVKKNEKQRRRRRNSFQWKSNDSVMHYKRYVFPSIWKRFQNKETFNIVPFCFYLLTLRKTIN